MTQGVGIGAAAAAAGLTPDAVRYYEREGLLPPIGRDAAGRRIYGRRALAQLVLVCELRDAGIAIADIRAIVTAKHAGAAPSANAARVRVELERLRTDVIARERALARARRRLDRWLSELDAAGL